MLMKMTDLWYAVEGFDCNGNCLLDSDNDGICDDDSRLYRC